MSQNVSIHKPAYLDEKVEDEGSSDVSSEKSERFILIQRDIKKLTGANIDIKPVDIDLSKLRKLVHTPKHGLIVPESVDFYKEQIEENQYLRSFIDGFDERLTTDMNLALKKLHSVELKDYLGRSNTIRQANSDIKHNSGRKTDKEKFSP